MTEYRLLYENPLTGPEHLTDFVKEGNPAIAFDGDGIILANADPEELGDHAHWVLWLNRVFPADIKIEWEFQPLREPGLCMLFFAALGREGQLLFSPELQERDGYYPQYHSGDINAYHISYYRRKFASERYFETCNLRKSHGFHLVAQGADPLPAVADAIDFYKLTVEKRQQWITFSINALVLFRWEDDGTLSPILKEGCVGFRQMAPMMAKYRNLKVFGIEEEGI